MSIASGRSDDKNTEVGSPTASGPSEPAAITTDSMADPQVSRIEQEVPMPSAEDMMRVIAKNQRVDEPSQPHTEDHDEEEVPADALSVVSDMETLRTRVEDLERELVASKSRESLLHNRLKDLRIDVTTLSTHLKQMARDMKRAAVLEANLAQEQSDNGPNAAEAASAPVSEDLKRVAESIRASGVTSASVDALTAIAQKGDEVTGKAVYRRRRV